MHKRWLVSRTNPEFVSYLSRAASISPLLSQILINRGIKTASDVQDFLNPGLTSLADPNELPDMRPAVERIRFAVRNGDRVLIHGDYDTDGVTATAIMVQALRTVGIDVHYFIPNRILHGYGFNRQAVDIAKKLGAKLIITVDCGVSSFEAAACAKREGIDVIITDHHEPSRRPDVNNHPRGEPREPGAFLLPDAVAVINPKLRPENPRLMLLSGAGIALKFAQALAAEDDLRFTWDDTLALFDLAALGTIADVVPLTGENRVILKEGLRGIQNATRQGIKGLKGVAGLNSREIKAGLLSFTIVPRINAAGRISDAADVVRLLLSEKEEEALELSAWLDGLNAERQKIEENVYQDARSKLDTSGEGSVIVLSGEGWHEGVLGIVAARIAEEFSRPAFIFSTASGVAKGSARSIPSFDICRGLDACSGLLLSYGGHKQAAGVRLEAGKIPDFTRAIGDMIRQAVKEEDLVPSLEIDANIPFSEITHALIKELAMLEPFGCGNTEPVFGAKELQVINPRVVGSNHLKMRLKNRSQTFDAIGFDMGTGFEELDSPILVDAAFSPSVNEWNGGRYLQLVLKAIRPSV